MILLKRFSALLLAFVLLASACTSTKSGFEKYSYEFLGAFDTMIQFIGYAQSKEQFENFVTKGRNRFFELHKLYDIYNSYEGINNIKTINDNAGIKPVEVRQEIIDIIVFSKEWHKKTGSKVNIALGPVLAIWHRFREEANKDPSAARLPDIEQLKKASEKTDISKVEVDEAKKTVYLREPGMSLDVGAVAKGFATEIVAKELADAGFQSFIISSGGNVRAVGKPMDNRSKWGIGIQDPNSASGVQDYANLDTVFVDDTSMVTSGDYQRYYVVNGQMIHHLIDPSTLMPANYYRAVTIMTKDSGVADFLSSAAFLLPYDKSRALVESMEGAEALWIMPDGTIKATDAMKKAMKKLGGARNN
ncbi:MAG: FAD:protein FMN transferase [Clostridia bacterium]|nr:FAD:protein FMN transferase [Clostridia bacterium]